jgi:hypothetical protein
VRTFEIPDGSPAEFVERARHALREIDFDDIVSLWLEDEVLVVRFARLGTSELRYRLTARDRGFRGELTASRVAPFHAVFRSGFEERFAQVITLAGGSLG